MANADGYRRGCGAVNLRHRRQAIAVDCSRLGGVYGIAQRATERKGPGTVDTFALGVTAKAPEFVAYQQGARLKHVNYDPMLVKEGTLLYVSTCGFCHGSRRQCPQSWLLRDGDDRRSRSVRVPRAAR